jgi:hypothetical protein
VIIAPGEKVFGALLAIAGAAIILTGHWATMDDVIADLIAGLLMLGFGVMILLMWSFQRQLPLVPSKRWTSASSSATNGQALAYVYFEDEPGGSLGGAPPHPRRGVAHRRQHRQAVRADARFAAVKRGVTRMQPHIHESVPCRLVLQLRTYRCNAVNRRFGPTTDSRSAANKFHHSITSSARPRASAGSSIRAPWRSSD